MNEYTIKDFSNRESYLNFVDYLLNNSDLFSLSFIKRSENELSTDTSDDISKILEPYIVMEEKTVNDFGFIIRYIEYKSDKNAIKAFEKADCLYDWKYPEFPSNLSFYKNGECVFEIDAQNRWNKIYLENEIEKNKLESIGVLFTDKKDKSKNNDNTANMSVLIFDKLKLSIDVNKTKNYYDNMRLGKSQDIRNYEKFCIEYLSPQEQKFFKTLGIEPAKLDISCSIRERNKIFVGGCYYFYGNLLKPINETVINIGRFKFEFQNTDSYDYNPPEDLEEGYTYFLASCTIPWVLDEECKLFDIGNIPEENIFV